MGVSSKGVPSATMLLPQIDSVASLAPAGADTATMPAPKTAMGAEIKRRVRAWASIKSASRGAVSVPTLPSSAMASRLLP